MTPLTNYLESPPPGYAVLLNGAWGAGKSFLWQRYARDTLPGHGLTPINISAAGLQTSDDLERALFQASISERAPTLLTEAGTVIGRAALRWLKVAPEDIELKANMQGGTTVVCIDDVERFAGPFPVLFGFIVSLIDATGVHVVLIADESRASVGFSEYGTYKERIVGRTISVQPDVGSFFQQTAIGFADQRSRAALQEHAAQAVELLQKRNVTNLRTVRFLLTEFEILIRQLPRQDQPLEIEILFNAAAFWALAVAKDARNARLVARAFSIQDLGMAIAMHEAQSRNGPVENNETDLDLLIELLNSTGFTNDAYGWPRSAAFVAFVQEQEFDFRELANDFGVAPNRARQGDDDPLTRVQHYHALSDDELSVQIRLLRAELDERESQSASRLFEVYRTVYWMAKRGLVGSTPEEITNWVIPVIRTYPLDRLSTGEVDYWMGPYDDLEQTVIAEMNLLTERFGERERAAARQGGIDFLVAGDGVAPEPVGGALFSEADPISIFERVRANGIFAIRRFLKFFSARLRVTNAPDYVGDDAGFAVEFAAKIKQEIQAGALMTIADSEFMELAQVLERFAAYTHEWRDGHGQE